VGLFAIAAAQVDCSAREILKADPRQGLAIACQFLGDDAAARSGHDCKATPGEFGNQRRLAAT